MPCFRHFILVISVLIVKTTFVKGLQCYTCINGRQESDCNWKKTVCEVDQEMCYTEIRNSGNGVTIMKSCYQSQACATLASQNTHECPRVCSLCCRGNLCNKRGPPECKCNLVSLIDLPRTTTRKPTTRRITTKRTKPTRRRTTTTVATITTMEIKPKTCEETSFVPIPKNSNVISCTNIDDHQFSVCQLIPGFPDDVNNIRHYHVALSDPYTAQISYHQCQHSLEGPWSNVTHISDESSVQQPLVLLCINMTSSDTSLNDDDSGADVRKSEMGVKTARTSTVVHVNCVVDDMSIVSVFNESMFNEFGSSSEQADIVMATEKATLEMKNTCKDRLFSMQCHLTATPVPPTVVETTTSKDTTTATFSTIPTTTEETTSYNETTLDQATQAKQLDKLAKVPTWGVSLIAVGCALLGIVILVVLIRQVGRKGFYLIHRKKAVKKVTPTHSVKA